MQQADETVPACRTDISWPFVASAQDDAQTLAVMLGAIVKLVEPGGAAHDLAVHARLIANTLAAAASDAADSAH